MGRCRACDEMLGVARLWPMLSSLLPLARYIIARGRHFHWMA
jgi:hypothetical protein